jgi:glycine oxidase
MHHPDICIAGAGVIGLSLALELHLRGYRVAVLEAGDPLAQASTAAAGMLAGLDPDNPPLLNGIAGLSLSLYPDFLDRIHDLSGIRVPFQTGITLQALPPHADPAIETLTPVDLARTLPQLVPGNHSFILLNEHSIDPRELAAALLAAVRATTIDLRSHTPVLSANSTVESVEIQTPSTTLHATKFVDCTGAWATTSSLALHVIPKKGQMLSVSLDLPLDVVLRTPEIYVVPRTIGPSAHRAIIGATVEDAAFDKTVHAADIAHLRDLASELLPFLADAPQLEAWSGIRPATADSLPLLGSLPGQPHSLLATGHYRNGILLAPATAHVMAQTITGETPSIDLSPFVPDRTPPVP